MTTIGQKIARYLRSHGYEWSFSDGRRSPKGSEVEKTLNTIIDQLATEDAGTQVELGRMIVKKAGTWVDVYVHIAEIKVK